MITCIFEDGGEASLRHVVVHAIVEKDGALLLVKRSPKISEGGKWSLPSGFLGRDETAEAATLRELREETGWSGEVTALFRIITRPDRPHEDRQNVAFVYVVFPKEKIGEKDWESTDVSWIPIDSLGSLDAMAFDHGETIRLYLAWRPKHYPLPITS